MTTCTCSFGWEQSSPPLILHPLWQVHDFLLLRLFADPKRCPYPNDSLARVAEFVLRTAGGASDEVARKAGQDNLKRLSAPLLSKF